MSERAWLVEWRFNGVQWLYLWPSAPGGFSFTADPNSALRFARREDAESALKWARDTDAARRPIGSLSRHGLALGEMLVTDHEWNASASPQAPAQRERDREADRARFPDPAFNRWLDEVISDAGHTVWDQVGSVVDAWHGWNNRPFYAEPAAQPERPHG